MPHPMHLHGHKFQMVEIDGRRFPGAVRDTVLEPPARRVVAADANNPGLWSIAICSTTSMPRCSRPCGTAVRLFAKASTISEHLSLVSEVATVVESRAV
jgi:hypothetical protein